MRVTLANFKSLCADCVYIRLVSAARAHAHAYKNAIEHAFTQITIHTHNGKSDARTKMSAKMSIAIAQIQAHICLRSFVYDDASALIEALGAHWRGNVLSQSNSKY